LKPILRFKETTMRLSKWVVVVLLLSATVWAQTTATTTKTVTRKTTKRTAATEAVTAEDVKSLRDALAAQQAQMAEQQKQIEQLRQELQQRNEASQTAVQQAQSQAAAAETKASEVQNAFQQQKDTVTQLNADIKDLRGNLTTTAGQVQQEQARSSALESLMGRFRFTGDVRVRNEDFFQSYSGCTSCTARVRERIRARLGIEGQLNSDFTAGMFFASGLATDPTSTNETLTGAFERKNFLLDRAYVIYQPQAHKWLQLTGGKFAYTWARTEQTFDADLNPEGFSERFSFDTHSSVVKNVTFTGMQLLYNEIGGKTTASATVFCPGGAAGIFCSNGGNTAGSDSYAVGIQASTKLQLGKRVTLTPAYTALKWYNENALLNGIASDVPTTGTGVRAGSTGAILPFPNGQTNATTLVGPTGAQALVYTSGYFYSDLLLDMNVDTGLKKFPLRVIGEYENNLDANKVSPTLGKQSHLYLGQLFFGQQKKQGDTQFAYGFWRQEQDSVLAAFNFSDQRAPTNVVQHFLQGSFLVRNNVTLAATLLVGRTLNSSLPNAALISSSFVGRTEPYLKRMQFDVMYKF
jgi:Putative porin